MARWLRLGTIGAILSEADGAAKAMFHAPLLGHEVCPRPAQRLRTACASTPEFVAVLVQRVSSSPRLTPTSECREKPSECREKPVKHCYVLACHLRQGSAAWFTGLIAYVSAVLASVYRLSILIVCRSI